MSRFAVLNAAFISRNANSVKLSESITFIRSDKTSSSAVSVEWKHPYGDCLLGVRSFSFRRAIRRRATDFSSNLLMTKDGSLTYRLDPDSVSSDRRYKYEIPWARAGLSHPWLTFWRKCLLLETAPSCTSSTTGSEQDSARIVWMRYHQLASSLLRPLLKKTGRTEEHLPPCTMEEEQTTSIREYFQLFWRIIQQSRSPTECEKCCF